MRRSESQLESEGRNPIGFELRAVEILIDGNAELGEQALAFEHARRADEIHPGEQIEPIAAA